MYLGEDNKLRSIHRHVVMHGEEEVSKEEMGFIREQVKFAKEDELEPQKTLAGYNIKRVKVVHEAGKMVTTVTLEGKDDKSFEKFIQKK